MRHSDVSKGDFKLIFGSKFYNLVTIRRTDEAQSKLFLNTNVCNCDFIHLDKGISPGMPYLGSKLYQNHECTKGDVTNYDRRVHLGLVLVGRSPDKRYLNST